MSWLRRAWDRILLATSRARPAEDGTEVHFTPDLTAYPLCGARVGAPWARNIAAVTCARCRELGLPMVIAYDASTR